ncbi:MAG: HWE histidine kinase domain-containing protein [Flavobacteriaceae bacterium]
MNIETGAAVDLTNCDREPIHLLGKVQNYGFLLGFGDDGAITEISDNAATFLNGDMPALGDDAGRVIPADTMHLIRNRVQHVPASGGHELISAVPLGEKSDVFDISVHRSDARIIVEAEPHDWQASLQQDISDVRNAVARLSQATSSGHLCRDAVRIARMMSGFDRVMLYKFLPDDSGEVVAEAAGAELEPFLGLRYPASDIPRQARALYVRNPIRIISDTGFGGSPVRSADSDRVIDLSDSVLRSVSEIHLEYLRNMGVAASMSISIVVEGRLWGLIACHHYAPRVLNAGLRNALLLFGQMLSLLLQSRLDTEARAHDNAAQNIASRISRLVSSNRSVGELIEQAAREFMPLVRADGVAVILDGAVQMLGRTPSRDECLALCRHIANARSSEIFHTHDLGRAVPVAADYVMRAAGLLSVPISRSPRDYILFFRRELVRTIKWAGNPGKPAEVGSHGIRLTPRKSFEAWQETVAGQSEYWSPSDLHAASLLRVTLLEVVLRLTDEVARERKTAGERQELLIAELNHRVRNVLGLVRGLITQSNQDGISTADFVDVLDSRIQALARAHDLVTRHNWQPSSLIEMIELEAESYLLEKRDRVIIEGDDVLLTPVAFSSVALVLHEMMTNSAKYGALTDQHGSLFITLTTDRDGALDIAWREEGGPIVRAPKRRGFGSTIVERTIPFELGGEASIDYHLSGVRARFVVPSMHVSHAQANATAAEIRVKPTEPETVAPERVLIVEDNLVIGIEAEDIFTTLGAKNCTVVSRCADALRHLEHGTFDFGFLDYNLGGETSLPVAEALARKGIPFAFATGYGEGVELPGHLSGTPCLGKPYGAEQIRQVLSGLRPGSPDRG